MPTLPISEFISRQIDEPKISQILEHMSSLIEEVVNYGSHVFRWAIIQHKGRRRKCTCSPYVQGISFSTHRFCFSVSEKCLCRTLQYSIEMPV